MKGLSRALLDRDFHWDAQHLKQSLCGGTIHICCKLKAREVEYSAML